MNRREFLRVGFGLASVSLLAACGGGAAPSAAPASSPASASPAKPSTAASASAKPAASAAASASAKPAASAAASGAASAKPAASAAPQATGRPAPSGGTTVKVATVGATSDVGFYLADERGYLQEEGLGISFERVQSGPQMIPFLASGQLDVAGGSTSGALYAAIQRDIPLRIVADKGSHRPGFTFAYVLVRKDLVDGGQVKGWADLKGKKVSISSTDNSGEVFVDKTMRSVGLTIKDVENPILGYPDHGPALSNKAIDACQTIEPFA